VQRAKVVSAYRLMRPASTSDHGGRVTPEARIASFSQAIVSAGRPFAVVDNSGRVLGEITPNAVIDLLAGVDAEGSGHGASRL
jgi:glycine betaine/proline transport system ATP-binding protein